MRYIEGYLKSPLFQLLISSIALIVMLKGCEYEKGKSLQSFSDECWAIYQLKGVSNTPDYCAKYVMDRLK